jgi:putative ATP-dependent endonuclease of the OLD family
MRVRRLIIENFRGIRSGQVEFVGHTLLVGGNNIGKSTVCEALDLVLGPDRLSQSSVINEHDFYRDQYLTQDRESVDITIRAILINLSDEALRRFRQHLRMWDENLGEFVDEHESTPEATDGTGAVWALPLIFIGRYLSVEDDFLGNTYFDHPIEGVDEDAPEVIKLGGGRTLFGRQEKRLCGFIYLRILRTGSRALSLQRGSLLDTVLRLHGGDLTAMWEETLASLRNLNPAIGEIKQIQDIRNEIHKRMAQFVNLSTDDSTAFFASYLTRDHLREVVKLFLSVHPDPYQIPFELLGTGTVNLLVFALLTFIAEVKGKQSVIFAMEEPEIALPPHTQRRVCKYIISEMGQAIITSHSPYVIEQFDPKQIVALNRQENGTLTSSVIQLKAVKDKKKYRHQRKQMAEAILSRAVLVVEGATEAAIFPVASDIMEETFGPSYEHLDLSGVTIFDATTDAQVPWYGSFFKSLGKMVFGFRDKQLSDPSPEIAAQIAEFDHAWESPEKGIENLLVNEMPLSTIKRFLEMVQKRDDYPTEKGVIADNMDDVEVKSLAREVLKVRKGDNVPYAAMLIGECHDHSELPETIKEILETIACALQPTTNIDKSEEEADDSAQ